MKAFPADKIHAPLKPSWMKETYLIDLSNSKSKELLYTLPTNNTTRISCQVVSPDKRIIMKNICKKSKNNYFLTFTPYNITSLNKYFYQNPPLDKFLLPNFILNIKIDSRKFKTKIYFYTKNYKPIIYTSALIKDTIKNTNICIFAIKDKQNLYLTSEFFTPSLNKKPNKIISVFENNQEEHLDIIPKELMANLQKKQIQIIYTKFKSQQTSCKLILSNGLTIASEVNNTFISVDEFIHNLETSTDTYTK